MASSLLSIVETALGRDTALRVAETIERHPDPCEVIGTALRLSTLLRPELAEQVRERLAPPATALHVLPGGRHA